MTGMEARPALEPQAASRAWASSLEFAVAADDAPWSGPANEPATFTLPPDAGNVKPLAPML